MTGYGTLTYQMDYRAQERERRLAHRHWADLAPKRRDHGWLRRLTTAVRHEGNTPLPAPNRPRFA
jgi:hypothetical protein